MPEHGLLTGLSAAGKSTIATGLARRLFDLGKTTVRLDGEDVRLGISRDLGFSAQERSENLRRISEVARLVNQQGFISIAALSAPKQSVRRRARDLIGGERYLEVFVDTPIEVCRERDPNGRYALLVFDWDEFLRVVRGDEWNLKITEPGDLAVAEAIIPN